MSTSEEAKQDDYSARLAKLKAKCADISHSSNSSANSSRSRTNDMSQECRTAIKNGLSDEIIEGMGLLTGRSDIAAPSFKDTLASKNELLEHINMIMSSLQSRVRNFSR